MANLFNFKLYIYTLTFFLFGDATYKIPTNVLTKCTQYPRAVDHFVAYSLMHPHKYVPYFTDIFSKDAPLNYAFTKAYFPKYLFPPGHFYTMNTVQISPTCIRYSIYHPLIMYSIPVWLIIAACPHYPLAMHGSGCDLWRWWNPHKQVVSTFQYCTLLFSL